MFTVKYMYDNGEVEFDEDVFETEEQAYDHGQYMHSCNESGWEILNMSNPGDNPIEDAIDFDFEVVEVDEK